MTVTSEEGHLARDAASLMKYRPLGRTGMLVSELGLGGASICGVLDRRGDEEGRRAIQMAVEAGINFFDTSDSYSLGRSEEMIGAALRDRRGKVFIATKGGAVSGAVLRGAARARRILAPINRALKPLARTIKQIRNATKSYDYSPAYLRSAVEASLRRLGTETIDLYQVYNPPPDVIRAGAFVEPMEAMKAAGMIRHWGISCRSVEDVPACAGVEGLETVQFPISLADQAGVQVAFAALAGRGIGVIVREALAQGFLTDSPETSIAELKEAPRSLVRARKARAEAHRFLATPQRSLAQAAIRFVLDEPRIATLLVGVASRRELAEDLGALGVPPFTAGERARIEALRAGRA